MYVYLTSYYPLCATKAGQNAIGKYGLPRYIDGSCRREPSFGSEFPCITGLCRPGFAEKLQVGDIVIYVTNKRGGGKRLATAVLQVIEKYESHGTAAGFFRKRGLRVPNNLMTDGTQPYPLDQTHRLSGIRIADDAVHLRTWDNAYWDRAKKGSVAICRCIGNFLSEPVELMHTGSNRKLIAQNPPRLTEPEFNAILGRLGVTINNTTQP